MALCGGGKKGDDDEKGACVMDAEDFDPETDAKVLRKAMKGMGTDEKKIIGVCGYRSSAQLVQVKEKYNAAFGRDLIKDLKSELKGDLEDAIVCRFHTRFEMDAWFCYKAMKGAGTDEKALIDILCTKSNDEMEEIKKSYEIMYDKTLVKAVKGDVSGDFQRLLVSLISAKREAADEIDEDKAKTDAKELKEAGIEAWGTDEDTFNRIICLRSYPQLRAVMKAYRKETGSELAEDVKKEFSGDIEKGLLTVLAYADDPIGYYSDQLYKAMKGMGTDEDTLTRVICCRCEIDLQYIKQRFRKDKTKELDKTVKKETKGDYEKILLALLKDP